MTDLQHSIPVMTVTTTRACWMRCAFCDLSQFVALKGGAHIPPAVTVQQFPDLWPDEQWVKIRGGLSVSERFEYFTHLVQALRQRTASPIEAYSAVELEYHHRVSQRPLHEMVRYLQYAGASTLGPGGGEWLSDPVRNQLSPHRLSAQRWLEIAQIAAQEGLLPAGEVVVAPFAEDSLREHLQMLKEVPLAHIEIKPLRVARTALTMVEPPHLLALADVVSTTREHFPSLPIYLSGPDLNDDSRWVLLDRGLTKFLDPVTEVCP